MRLRLLWVPVENQRLMLVSKLRKFVVALPTVAINRRGRCDILFHKLGKRIAATVGNHLQAQAPRGRRFLIFRSFAVLIFAFDALDLRIVRRLLRSNFNCADYRAHMMNTATYPS